MNEFGKAFRRARLMSDLTFREIANEVGKSIGYLSEIESGKKNPPEKLLVGRIEQVLGVNDGHLQAIAEEMRFNLPSNINHLVRSEPKLGQLLRSCEIFFRDDQVLEDNPELARRFEELLNHAERIRQEVKETGISSRGEDRLFGNLQNLDYSGMGVLG